MLTCILLPSPTSISLLIANTEDQKNVGLNDLRFVEQAVGRVCGHQLSYN